MALFVVLALVYFGSAFAFAHLYTVVPLVADSGAKEPRKEPMPDFWTALHFSFTAQSTVGYGDYRPLESARWVAAGQTFWGFTVTAIVCGILVARLVRRGRNIVVPAVVCYDPKMHTYLFRFVNRDADDLTDVHITAVLRRDPRDETFIDTAAKEVSLTWKWTDFVPPLHFMATRTTTNNGEPTGDPVFNTAEKEIPTPLSLIPGDAALIIDVRGTYISTGDISLTRAVYRLADVRCGLYRTRGPLVVGLKRRMSGFVATDPDVCMNCPFHHDCQFEVAQTVRAKARRFAGGSPRAASPPHAADSMGTSPKTDAPEQATGGKGLGEGMGSDPRG